MKGIKGIKPFVPEPTYKIVSLSCECENGNWKGKTTFAVLDGGGNEMTRKSVSYEGEEWNMFFNAFNSGTYLYQDFAVKNKLTIPAPLALEDDFINSVPSPSPIDPE